MNEPPSFLQVTDLAGCDAGAPARQFSREGESERMDMGPQGRRVGRGNVMEGGKTLAYSRGFKSFSLQGCLWGGGQVW